MGRTGCADTGLCPYGGGAGKKLTAYVSWSGNKVKSQRHVSKQTFVKPKHDHLAALGFNNCIAKLLFWIPSKESNLGCVYLSNQNVCNCNCVCAK